MSEKIMRILGILVIGIMTNGISKIIEVYITSKTLEDIKHETDNFNDRLVKMGTNMQKQTQQMFPQTKPMPSFTPKPIQQPTINGINIKKPRNYIEVKGKRTYFD